MNDEQAVYRVIRHALQDMGLAEPVCRLLAGRIANLLTRRFRIKRSEVSIHEGLWKETKCLIQEIFTHEEMKQLSLEERAAYATEYLFGGLDEKYEFLVKTHWYESVEEDAD